MAKVTKMEIGRKLPLIDTRASGIAHCAFRWSIAAGVVVPHRIASTAR